MENEEIYICHYCIKYNTNSRCDMKKHFTRKNKCKCATTLSYEDSKNLTLGKTFIFTFDKSLLNLDDYLFIVNNFNNISNIINIHFRKEIKNKINNLELENKNDEFNEDNLNEDNSNKDNLNNDDKNKNKDNELFDIKYYNKEKKCYMCNDCLTEFTRKYNLIKHLNNKKSCLYKQNIQKLIKKNDEISLISLKKEEEDRNKYKDDIIQNIQQNIQNIGTQNNNNNTQNNNYNFAIKDFVNDRYDISHIKDSFYEKKDFFLYPNFLQMIMENEKNRNIFFVDKEAVFYMDNELNKMSSDKAGYMILDKLSESFDQLLYRQDKEARDYYSFITKYYHVIKGHYKHDTIFKEYNVDDRQFYYTSQGNLFRSRDKYLGKIVGTVNKFSDETREVINKSGHHIKNIPVINPNIEDYASTKMRYRDLKDSNKW